MMGEDKQQEDEWQAPYEPKASISMPVVSVAIGHM
jgi:hypothetical protein